MVFSICNCQLRLYEYLLSCQKPLNNKNIVKVVLAIGYDELGGPNDITADRTLSVNGGTVTYENSGSIIFSM